MYPPTNPKRPILQAGRKGHFRLPIRTLHSPGLQYTISRLAIQSAPFSRPSAHALHTVALTSALKVPVPHTAHAVAPSSLLLLPARQAPQTLTPS